MNIDERYLDLHIQTLDYDGLHIQVKLDEEGVILDVFKDGENIVTKSKYYEDFGLIVKEMNKWKNIKLQ